MGDVLKGGRKESDYWTKTDSPMALRLLLILLSSSLILAGCTTHRSARTSAPSAHAKARYATPRPVVQAPRQILRSASPAATFGAGNSPYVLGSGDRIRITVFGQENLSRIYPVDASGYISMPLIGAVAAGGMSTFQLEERITAALRQKYVKDPKVTVEVETYRPFFILGEVRNGGQFPYVAGMTVQTAVAIAGGFTARARKSKVQVSRQVHGQTVVRMVPPTWKIQPGDTIAVKERFL